MIARRVSLIAAFCFGLAVSSVYGDGGAAQTKPADSSLRVTVIGCVQRSEPAPTATVGTTAIPEGATKYLLSNITLAEQRAATGTSAGADPAANLVTQNVSMYRLDDSADALIAPHVGDRVEVTGRVVASQPAPRGTAGTVEPAASESMRAPMLRVEELRKISSNATTCSKN